MDAELKKEILDRISAELDRASTLPYRFSVSFSSTVKNVRSPNSWLHYQYTGWKEINIRYWVDLPEEEQYTNGGDWPDHTPPWMQRLVIGKDEQVERSGWP